MTEAMSRREIEDILTSIRKLVSHDPATTLVSSAAPDPGATPLGKLVLTSALRVPDASHDQFLDDGFHTLPDLPDRNFNWPTDEMLDQHVPRRLNLRGAATDHPSVPSDAETSASLLSRITRSARPVTDVPPVAPTISAMDAGNIDAAPQVVPTELADAQHWLDDVDIPIAAIAPQADALPDTADAALEETLARLEAMLSGQNVPDTTPTGQADYAEQDVTATMTDTNSAAPIYVDTTAASSDDTTTIDEAMLYQLVANIVRQELQGELGEKITRAIRKLVRSEVARELQLRDM